MNEIYLRGVQKCFDSGFCLRDVDLRISGGEIFAFIGANGSGKTTTIRNILGLMNPDKGEVKITANDRAATYKDIGITLENETPFEGLTPVEYLDFFLSHYKFNPDKRKGRIENILKYTGLDARKNDCIKDFSKGMKKQLVIAKSLLHEPEILIMDEPFDGLSPEIRKGVKELLRDFANKGKIVFLSTHNLDEAENFCSSFGIMKNGNFLGKWYISDINTSLENFYFDRTKEQLL